MNLRNFLLVSRIIYTEIFFLTIIFKLRGVLMFIEITSFARETMGTFKMLGILNTVAICLFRKTYNTQIFVMVSFKSRKFKNMPGQKW